MSAPEANPTPIARRSVVFAVAAVAFFVAMRLAVRGVVPNGVAMVMVPATFVATLAALAPLADAFGLSHGPHASRPFGFLRPGLGVTSAASILWLPTLGTFGLVDPWETHYAEVARELVERHDFISPWWANDGWFRSKPILIFWLEAISMRVFGAHTAASEVLGGSGVERPEWAIRFPVFVFALVAVYAVYRAVTATSTPRRGAITALVLTTMPHWVLVARQAITDMPYVAGVTIAVMALVMAFETPDDALVRSVRVRIASRIRTVDASHVLRLVLVAIVLPQCLYLVSRNVDFVWTSEAHGFAWHVDTIRAGSPGNLGLPGQPADVAAAAHWKHVEPVVQGLAWAVGLGAWLFALRGERRVRHLWVIAAWAAASVATMSKGIVGVVLPAAVFVGYAVSTGRFALLKSAELVRGAAVFLLIVGPWYLASYARHGNAFWDELVLRHMIGRTLEHLHDTNEGDDVSLRYYVAQLGYGTFPWCALLPAALARAIGGASIVHGDERDGRGGRDTCGRVAFLFALASFALVTVMKTKFHHYVLPVVPGLAVLVGREVDALVEQNASRERERPSAGLVVFGAAVALLVGLDMTATKVGGGEEGQARLLNLFTYIYRRPFPSAVDSRTPILVCAIATTALALALLLPRARKLAAIGLVVTSCAFAAFVSDVYLPRLAPHWGQRELVERFVRSRAAPDEALVAYAMNWKGENYYSGNHVAIFAVQGSTPGDAGLVDFVANRVAHGTTATFIVVEHGRVGGLRNVLDSKRADLHLTSFQRLTDETLNNKFCLVEARFEGARSSALP